MTDVVSDAPTFDRDATKEALPVVAQALMNGGVQGCDEFAAGAAVLDAARWALAVTEGARLIEVVCYQCEGSGEVYGCPEDSPDICVSCDNDDLDHVVACPGCDGSGGMVAALLRPSLWAEFEETSGE